MGTVIQGPWRRPKVPDMTRVLSDEIARMTRALEELRELHLRSERAGAVDLSAVGEARTD
jgi:hypothetical protein